MNTIYITTPIYYVNAKPHIGHAYTNVVCDVYARVHRMLGYSVLFSTGTDEHGKKIEQSAEVAGIEPQIFVNKVSSLFKELLPILNISNDDFVRTTDLRHQNAVAHFWNVLEEKGYIYLGEYSGWYDIKNEAYFSDEELVDGKSPFGENVEVMREPCYFFKLSEFGDKLLEYYDLHPDFIYPISRKNEIVNFVKNGLKDLAISRTMFSWGIKVPNDPKHVVYVWLDALTNYLTVNGYPENEDQNNEPFWQNVVHFVGKEIVRFHALYWPAFLMAAGISLPKQIVAHGWWMSDGEKMSKSLGNVQDPKKYCKLFGSDALRYFMLRELSFGADGNFSLDGFVARNNGFLANSYGNLCQRVISFIYQKCEGVVSKSDDICIEDEKFSEDIRVLLTESLVLVRQYAFHKYLEKIEAAVALANQYMDSQKPWLLKISDPKRMQDILYVLLEAIYKITKFLYPVIPLAAEKLLGQMDIVPNLNLDAFEKMPKVVRVEQPEILFQKIDQSAMQFDVFEENE